MSGHSKWSTIKRKKEANDIVRGKIFSKLSKAISIAIKTGGGADPETNYKLRMAIDAAKDANMPKANIDRAINKAEKGAENLEEITYEGFGPGGIAVLVEATTDNRRRTGQEFKNMFENSGGNLGEPGSASYNFEAKGLIEVKKTNDVEEQMLTLIDLGVDDVQEGDGVLEVYTAPQKLYDVKSKVEGLSYEVTSVKQVKNPKNTLRVSDKAQVKKTLDLLETLSDHDDVQDVFANVDIVS